MSLDGYLFKMITLLKVALIKLKEVLAGRQRVDGEPTLEVGVKLSNYVERIRVQNVYVCVRQIAVWKMTPLSLPAVVGSRSTSSSH